MSRQVTLEGEVHRVRQLDDIPVDEESEGEEEVEREKSIEYEEPPEDDSLGAELSTILLDVHAECIVPKLTIDKRNHDVYGVPVVKFTHTSIPDKDIHRQPDPRFANNAPGTITVGGGRLDPARGIVSALLRGIMFKNESRCACYARFRIREGPFKIVRMETQGKWPENRKDEYRVTLEWKRSAEVWIEFMPPPWKNWESEEQTYEGDLLVEYLADLKSDEIDPSESQRIKLIAVCRKPKLVVDVVADAILCLCGFRSTDSRTLLKLFVRRRRIVGFISSYL